VGLSWPQIVFGWPAVITALALHGYALAVRRWVPSLVGFFVALPFLWYLSGFPAVGYWAALIALANLASVVGLARRQRVFAVIALLPFLAAVSWLAYTVVSQNNLA